ncbi:MAG: hypothetical protein A4E34_00319 [Methanoregula sp. PtaU1.Bin006]|uniref:DUF3006 domain-containing protein n=1 Tax=Methanoregula sp. PtaU1.Bin006 TaxID=1811681 RepID=UPI0009C6DBF1|nr:DUF3006 domain-containing protein [Methanoregula sp. PtaU1.Bin006]OPY36297.1 MAG: hypothetical protein A4E34_00319 [Methanoregula sp. PtaU1.Bin006]
MKVSIDRIEEGIAVLIVQEEPSLRIRIPASLLPAGSREGDILDLILEPDPAATAAARERVSGLIGKMKKKQ